MVKLKCLKKKSHLIKIKDIILDIVVDRLIYHNDDEIHSRL